MDYEQYLREKITSLRIEQNLSEYQLSTEIGRCKTYIQAISSGKSLPSFESFFDICEYFGLTPAEFFIPSDITTQQRRILRLVETLSSTDLDLVEQLIERLSSDTSERSDL